MEKNNGITIVFTGNGKGKTSAALGIALRAGGRGMNTLVIQFLKEEGASGEQNLCPSVVKNIDIYSFGKGFVFQGDSLTPHIEAVEKGWDFMKKASVEKVRYSNPRRAKRSYKPWFVSSGKGA